MAKMTHGAKAWLGLMGYVAMYDGYAVLAQKDTMSQAFLGAVKHPYKRWPVIAAWIYITCHLFKFIPERVDPLRRIPTEWIHQTNQA